MTIDELDPERPSVYELESGLVVYRASALGHCMGNLTRVRLGMDPDMPPEWLEAAFEWGTEAEPETLRWLGTQGFKLLDGWELESQFVGSEIHAGQLETQLPVGTSTVVKCHPDGIGDVFMADVDAALSTGTRVVVEAKRLSDSWAYEVINNGAEALPPYYKYQVAVEMHSTGFPCVFVVAVSNKESHEIVDHQWFPILEPPVSLKDIKLRVIKIEAAFERGDIPECDYAQYPCGFWREHDTKTGVWVKSKAGKAKQREKKGEAVRAKDVGIDEGELDKLIEEYIKADRIIKVLGPEAKAEVQGAIEKILDGKKLKGKRVHTGKYDLNDTVTESPGRAKWKDYALSLGGKTDEAPRGEPYSLRYPKITKLGEDDG